MPLTSVSAGQRLNRRRASLYAGCCQVPLADLRERADFASELRKDIVVICGRRGLLVALVWSPRGPVFERWRDIDSEAGRGVARRRVRRRRANVARDILGFATIEGARACRLDHKIGSVAVGKQADLVLLDLGRINVAPVNDPVGSLVQSADTSTSRGCSSPARPSNGMGP